MGGPQCKCAQCEGLRKAVAFVIAVPSISDIDTGLLGLAITIGKPILLITKPGLNVPDKLAKVVDRFVEISSDATPLQIIEAVKTAMIDMGLLPGEGPVRPGYDTEPSQN